MPIRPRRPVVGRPARVLAVVLRGGLDLVGVRLGGRRRRGHRRRRRRRQPGPEPCPRHSRRPGTAGRDVHGPRRNERTRLPARRRLHRLHHLHHVRALPHVRRDDPALRGAPHRLRGRRPGVGRAARGLRGRAGRRPATGHTQPAGRALRRVRPRAPPVMAGRVGAATGHGGPCVPGTRPCPGGDAASTSQASSARWPTREGPSSRRPQRSGPTWSPWPTSRSRAS